MPLTTDVDLSRRRPDNWWWGREAAVTSMDGAPEDSAAVGDAPSEGSEVDM
jgi:hypothetical protein